MTSEQFQWRLSRLKSYPPGWITAAQVLWESRFGWHRHRDTPKIPGAISTERARQIVLCALRKLRKKKKSMRILREFWEEPTKCDQRPARSNKKPSLDWYDREAV